MNESIKEFKLDEETDEIFESWFASLFSRHINLFMLKRLWGIIFISNDDNFIISIAKSFIYFLIPVILSNQNELKKILSNHLKEIDIENVITKAIEINKNS